MDNDAKALSSLRLDKARDCLETAKELVKIQKYYTAVNRCYYAVFHAMRAVLAMDRTDRKHHSALIAEFRKRYIKTEIFDTELSKIITVLFDSRTDSDYDDYYTVTEAEVNDYLDKATLFVDQISAYLEETWNAEN